MVMHQGDLIEMHIAMYKVHTSYCFFYVFDLLKLLKSTKNDQMGPSGDISTNIGSSKKRLKKQYEECALFYWCPLN